jgi:hypothetical protein
MTECKATGAMASRTVKLELALLTAAFVLTGLVFAVGTPLFQAPDEPQHLDLVHHYAHHPVDIAGPDLRVRQGTRQAVADVGLRDYLAPVSFEAVPPERPRYRALDEPARAGEPAGAGCPVTCQNYHYAHPQLPYLLAAPLVRVLDGASAATLVLVLRALGVLVVAPVVVLTWFAAAQLWGPSDRRALGAAAAIAFAGPLAAAAAAVNNDAPTILLGGGFVAVVARLLHVGYRPRLVTLLAVLTAVGMWTKAHFLPLALVAVLAVAVATPPERRADAAKRLAVPLLVGALWWVIALVRLGGLSGGSEILAPPREGPWRGASFAGYVLDRAPDLLSSAWGIYGWLAVRAPDGWRTGLTVGALLLLGGAAVTARRWRPDAVAVRRAVLAGIPVLLALASLRASFAVYRVSGERRGVAGRYLYPALPVLAIGASAAAGTLAVSVRRAVAPAHVLAAGIAAAAVVGTAGSLAVALHGLYDTRSVGVLLDRASVVSPWAAAPVVLPLLVIAWIATVSGVVWSVLRDRP